MCKKLSFLVSCILVLGLVGNAWAVIGQKDIDSPGIPGSASEAAGVWTITGSGHDIWGTGDALQYVYRPMAGDGELVVDLVSRTMDPLHSWSKIGVMIRETSDTGAKSCAFVYTGQAPGSGNEYQIAYRVDTGGDSFSVDTSGAEMPPAIPQTLKIVRAGNTIQSWWYKEVVPGIIYEWTLFGQVDITMTSDVLIGMAVCSHDNGVPITATYQNVIWPAGLYEKAWDLLPLDGAQNMPLQPTLSWRPGDSATSHDVYLGTDPAALALVDTKALGDESYTSPTPLAEGTKYYWQIVEQPGSVAGPVLSFKTQRPPGFGQILREVWEGIGGTMPVNLYTNSAYPCCPSWSDLLPSMASYDFADNYGARMQGYLVPETSGDYKFWIAADDGCELWLSTDEKSCNAVRIAYHNAWTGAHNWFWYGTQESAAIPLVANQKYFIRAVWKEGGGGDNCQVAWNGPDQPSWPVDGSNSAVISGYYLMPADDGWAGSPSIPDGATVTPLEAAEPVSWAPGKNAVAHNVYFGSDPGAMALIATVPMPDTSIVLPTTPVGSTSYWAVEADDGTQTYPPCGAWSFSVQEWVSIDIGRANPIPAGSASYDEATGVYTLKAGGNELWGQADEFHYYYTTMKMTRDTGEIKARVLSIDVPDSWRRAGVQIRETTAANSRKVMAHKTGHDNTRMQWREQPGWDTWNGPDNWGLGFPTWVRVTRDHDQFSTYYSLDGENWNYMNTVYCPMQADKWVCVGLALCHHNSQPQDQLSTGMFDNLSIKTADPRASWAPSPSDGAGNIPLDVTLSWNAGEDAGEHLLYISQNYEDVLYGLVSPIPLPADTTEYHVGKLDLGKVYYWAVDEARREGRDLLVTFGDVWSFQVEPYRLLEDFEPYCVAPEPLPEQVTIPGDILVEAVPPADQAWVDPQVLVEAVAPDAGCLIAEWAFEGNFDDTSGSGFNGTPMGEAAIVVDAERGQVLSLDGDLDYVDCGNPAALDFSTGNWSLSAWVKNTMTGTGDTNKGCIVGKGGDGGGGHRYCLIVTERTEGQVDLVTDDNVNKRQVTGATKVNNDVWHHVLGVREGDTIKIYTDGKLESSTSLPAGYDLSGTSQHEILIGAIYNHNNGTPYVYKDYAGLIDDVQIYNCALTEGNARYMAGIGNLEKPGYYGPCIVHYALDEGSGLTATDSSGNGFDGAITDAAWTAVTADGSAACLDFNGFGGNVLNAAIGPYLNNLGALSISMWVQSDLIDTDKGFIMLGDSASDRWGARYDAAGGDGGGDDVIKYGVNTTGGNEEDESSSLLQTTEWQHLVVTWQSGAGLKLWVNGVMDVPSSNKGPVSGVLTGYTKILVGKGSKDLAADASWDGRIDDVRVYDKALSEGEVRYLAGVGHSYLPDWYSPMIVNYEFEGDASDSSGNGLDGTLFGDANVEDGVLKLDGAGDYLDVGNTPLTNITGQVTVSAWIKLNTVGPDMKVAGNEDGAAGGYKLGVYSDGKMEFEIRTSGNSAILNRSVAGGTALTPDVWYHVAGVYSEGNYIRTYVNGRLDRELPTTEVLGSTTGTLKIGREPFSDGGYLNGMVDGFRVYNTALSYEQISGLAGCENPIGNTWFDNGFVSPLLDYEVAHGGSQSMRVEFNGPWQLVRIPPFEDLTAGDAKALTMYFKGDAGNMPGLLFAQLNPGCTVEYSGSPEDLMNPDWQEWNIALADFPCEVSPSTLMGVGASSGSGVVWFDDMRLYPSRCVPSLSSITDLNQDCSVDGKDLRILAGDYLMYDETSTGLVLRYEFEGNLEDSSGFGRTGTAHGAGIGFEDDPNMGMVLSLPGGDNIYVSAPPVGISGNMPTTIACWAKADHTSIPDWTLVFGFSTPGGDCGSHFNIGSIGGPGGVGAHVWCWEATIFTDNEALEWRHYAMTFDGGTIKYYGDGALIGQLGYDLWRRGDYVNVGKRNTQSSSFPGKVDDARVYKRELSEAEIGTVMAGGEVAEVYFPINSIANIYDEEPVNSKIVNLKDFALIGNDWLFEIVWP